MPSTVDVINKAFISMEDEVRNNPSKYMLASRIRFAETLSKHKIIIAENRVVPHGSALNIRFDPLRVFNNDFTNIPPHFRSFFADLFRKAPERAKFKDPVFFIFVNPNQARDNKSVRLCIAHELGHICNHHFRVMMEMEGTCKQRDDFLTECEKAANIFAANVYYAVGDPVERHILSNQEFEKDLEVFKNRGGDVHDAQFRKRMIKELIQNRYVKHPVALLCRCLQRLESQLAGVSSCFEKANLIHREYRVDLFRSAPSCIADTDLAKHECGGCSLRAELE
jgi:hypothetical protein